jgi:hypothetical protein
MAGSLRLSLPKTLFREMRLQCVSWTRYFQVLWIYSNRGERSELRDFCFQGLQWLYGHLQVCDMFIGITYSESISGRANGLDVRQSLLQNSDFQQSVCLEVVLARQGWSLSAPWGLEAR